MDQSVFTVVSYKKKRAAGVPVIFKPTQPDRSFWKVNPNLLASAVVTTAQEKVLSHRLNKDGSLVVTMSSVPAANRLLAVTELAGVAVEARVPYSYSATYGRIQDVPVEYSDDDLKEYSSEQGVISAKRQVAYIPNEDGVVTETRRRSVILEFSKDAPLPNRVSFGFCSYPVTKRPLHARPSVPLKTPTNSTSTSLSTASRGTPTRESFAAPEAFKNKVPQYRLFCFFNRSAQQSVTSLDVSQIPVGLCTHLVYSSAGINSRGFTLNDAQRGAIERFAAFGQPSKLLIGVGESRQDWRAYQDIASDHHIATNFGLKLRRWLHDRNLDGAVIDWPVPAEQKDATVLVRQVKRAFADEQLLAVLLPHDQKRRRRMFDVRRLVMFADFLLFRMYGSHGLRHTAYPITEQDVSLFPKAARSETGRDAFKKACMVLPLSGLSFLRDVSTASLAPGAPARGPGPAGRHSRKAGSLAYHELCAGNWTQARASHYGTAASRGSIWVGYHDPTQLARIVHVLRRRHGASCFGLWALEDDDFSGSCGVTTFPLVRAVAAECKATRTA
ncbi:hypothetical protein MTO96_040541 [Rhipicephalus appendiculatus]